MGFVQDYSQQCFVGPHLTYVLALGVPALILLVMGFPLAQTLLLRHHMPKSGPKHLRGPFWANYGTLYDTYRPRLYLWGSTTELRKLLLLGLITAVQGAGGGAQGLAVESGLLLLVFVVMWLMPWRSKRMNLLQLALLCSVMQTVHLGIMLPLVAPELWSYGTQQWHLQTVAVAIDLFFFLFLVLWIVGKAGVAVWTRWPDWIKKAAQLKSSLIQKVKWWEGRRPVV